jgi:ABC-type nitrate/sulfonate/bicarbonate transport system permease component
MAAFVKNRLPGAILILCLLALWQVSSINHWVDAVELPPV